MIMGSVLIASIAVDLRSDMGFSSSHRRGSFYYFFNHSTTGWEVRCGSRCSRSVRQLVERKLSPISSGLTFSEQLQESGHTGQLVSGDSQED